MFNDAVKFQSTMIMVELLQYFPGLMDGETEVNGADLVETLTVLIRNDTSHDVKKLLKQYSKMEQKK